MCRIHLFSISLFITLHFEGDPLPDTVILWTRYTPISANETVTLELRMLAVDPKLPLEVHLDPARNPNVKRVNVKVSEVIVSQGSRAGQNVPRGM
jgi:phosphodiesterase/alkaline phosphatase D-like protein